MMERYGVTFSPIALDDIEQTINYYKSTNPALEARFNKQLQATLNAIRRNALFASVHYDDIRCAQIRKFPYSIHYHVASDREVTVVAVYSSYKQPLWE